MLQQETHFSKDPSSTPLFDKFTLSTDYMPGTVQSSEDTAGVSLLGCSSGVVVVVMCCL